MKDKINKIKQHLLDKAKLTIFIDVTNKKVSAKYKCFESIVDLDSTIDSVENAIDGLAELIAHASEVSYEIFQSIEIDSNVEANDNLPKDFETIH